jgi:predicted ribosome quality control (RQC) complex YloA/Tae2 family protein
MSLNCREIDLVLSELDLVGAKIEKVLQPSYDSLVLRLYKAGRETDLLISIAHGACRLHSLSSPPPKPERPLRFQECLKSRIRGGRIEALGQIGTERVVRFDISVSRADLAAAGATVYKALGVGSRNPAHPEPEPESSLREYRLYARLWSGAGNIILVDSSGAIVDVMARRPKRGELSGEACRLEEELAAAAAGRQPKEFLPRDLEAVEGKEGGGSFNERLEAFYAAHGGELSREKLLEVARDRHAKRRRGLEQRVAELERRVAEFRDGERLRELGDILMANPAARPTGHFVECEDFYRGGSVAVEVEPSKTMVENAQAYYEKYRKAGSGLAEVEAELAAAHEAIGAADAELARIEALSDPLLMARALAKGGTARTERNRKRPYPGLSLERNGWTILVGRSAKENDELLRRHVRGSDLWMHARDYAGSYVFVKARAGKSFPLDIMLDAGNLAIYYSKGRANGGGELYYTQAKHLRRAKDGPKGLVLPSNEKNLHVNLDEARLRELKDLIGEE